MKFSVYQNIMFLGEMFSFFASGVYFAKKIFLMSFFFMLLALTIAYYLGKAIEDNALGKFGGVEK